MFGGDLSPALAGYNAGEKNVVARIPTSPFQETKAYVPKVRIHRKYQLRM
jgi:soluble lytic murein transglycosylase-like protein